jgi:hypothetical protein
MANDFIKNELPTNKFPKSEEYKNTAIQYIQDIDTKIKN